MKGLPFGARLFIGGALVCAVLIGIGAIRHPISYSDVAVLGVIYVIFDSRTLRVGPRATVGLGMGFPVTLASFIIVGPWGAALVGACSALVIDRTTLVKRFYNGAQSAICAFVAGLVFVGLNGRPVGHLIGADFPHVLLPVLAADIVHCVLNAVLLTAVICLSERVTPREVLFGTLFKSAGSYLGYGIFGLLMAVLWVGVGVQGLAGLLVLLPLLVARWAISQFAVEQQAYSATIAALVQAVETKDHYTRGHSERVARGSVLIARVIGMGEDRLNALRYAGILHDVGKLGVPTKLLQKTGRLTEDEFSAIKLHPVRGLEMLSDIEFLDEAFKGILHHHERIDGLGYPMGLAGGQIPEFARVIAVADAFDSMTSTRSYRRARSDEDAMAELRRCKGSQFDPRMVDALIAALEREPWVRSDVEDVEKLDRGAVPAADHDDPQFLAQTIELQDDPR
jgi:hypothetical protein